MVIVIVVLVLAVLLLPGRVGVAVVPRRLRRCRRASRTGNRGAARERRVGRCRGRWRE